MKKLAFIAFFVILNLFQFAQTQMPIGPHAAQFTGMVRGYHFTAPVAFNICALYIPPDAPGAAGQNQHIRVVRFTAGNPPAFPGTTNAFVQLFSITNAGPTQTVACNIPVNAGDVIGIYGARAANCINSYNGANFATTIMGQPTTCRRSGMQACIAGGAPMANIWSEVNFNIGRIFMYYNCCPTPTITTGATATNVCSGASVTIFGSGANNYTWTPGNFNTPSVTINPTTTTVFTLLGDVNGCVGSNTLGITVADYPSYTVTPQQTTVCMNSNFTTSLAIGNQITGTPCSTTGVGPVCANPAQLTFGSTSGQNTNTQFPAIYANFSRNSRHQMLVRATELTAAGIGPGYLTSLSFSVAALSGATNYPNFTIRLKCTGATTSGFFFDNANLSQVYTAANHNVTLGWNTHTFQTPYYWDGTSNLLVDVCYSMLPNNTSNCSTAWETTPFVSCSYYQSSVFQACLTNNFATTTTNRPRMRFGNCAISNPNSFSYTYSPTSNMVTPNASVTIVNPTPITASIATQVYSIVITPTTAYCPIEKTFTATVINPLTPTLTPVNPVCNTFGPITLTANPSGGTWSGNPAVSANGIFTPSLAAIGNSTVMYSVGVGQCIATNTMILDVSQFYPATITATVGSQCHSFPAINLFGLVQSTVNGSWSGTGVTSNSFIPTGLPTGAYVLTYSTTSASNATLCPDSQTTTINVLNPITPTISADVAYCTNMAPLQLTVTPANSGTWIATGYLNSNGIFTPSLALLGGNTVQYVVGTVTCNVTSSLNINVEQFVPAVLTGTAPDKCNTDPLMSLSGYVTNQTGTWSGPGVSGATFDPATSGVGALTLTYTTHSMPTPSLCPDQAVLTVKVFSLAPPVITPAGPICNTHAPFKIITSPLGGYLFSYGSFALDVNGLFNPAMANIGANVITYSITSGPCVAVSQSTINVEKYIQASIVKVPGPFCKNDPPVNLYNYVQFLQGDFKGPGVTGGIFDPSKANIGDNNVITYKTHSMPTASLCPDSATVRVKINDYPHITINSSLEKGCEPLEVLCNTPEVNRGNGVWNFGDGSGDISGLNVVHTFSVPGSYNVHFTYTDEVGCKAKVTLPSTIEVFANPQAFFTFDPSDQITLANPAVNFTNKSITLGHNNYQWQVGDMYMLTDVNPRVVFPAAGDYNITLTAVSFDGCKASYSQIIHVKNDFGVYIPNAFTPNWDGLNDYFTPVLTTYGVDQEFFEMEIFDRWGHSLFKTKEYGIGWDGSVQNKGEEMLKEGVYIYKIRYKDMEGKIYNRTGHVTLMK